MATKTKLQNGEIIEADAPLMPIGRTERDYIALWMSLRFQEHNITNTEAARRMGIHPRTLSRYIQKGIKEGWLVFSDPLSRIEHEIIPKTLDNMSEFLDQKDKQVTIETFKSTVARHYQESKGVSDAPKTILALKIETADPEDKPKAITGYIVGKAKEIAE